MVESVEAVKTNSAEVLLRRRENRISNIVSTDGKYDVLLNAKGSICHKVKNVK